MKELIDAFVSNSTTILTNIGPIGGVFLIILESIFPMLPLSVFITLNMISFGSFFGFIISWLSTIIGCMLSFTLFRHFFQKKLYRFIKKKEQDKFADTMKAISNINFSNLVMLIAIPFSPAFLINIAGGLSKIKTEKFFLAIMIGKIVIVYFWGYIGTTLLESLTNIMVLFKIGGLLVLAFFISKLVEKKLKVR
ncbi:MAG: VTT domain-containing protein [Tenericutes bacterium]|nr:VTT domain-containing protein [Mycoplasmatota bacterium]